MNPLYEMQPVILPIDYIPQPQDVICGKTKQAYNHVGNRRFRITISPFLNQYNDRRSRAARGALIVSLCDMIHDNGGRFLKLIDKRWVTQSAAEARNKIGHALRDSNSQQQKVSTNKTRPRTSSGGHKNNNKSDKHQIALFEPIPFRPPSKRLTTGNSLVCSIHSIQKHVVANPEISSLAQHSQVISEPVDNLIAQLAYDWPLNTDSAMSDNELRDLIHRLDWGGL